MIIEQKLEKDYCRGQNQAGKDLYADDDQLQRHTRNQDKRRSCADAGDIRRIEARCFPEFLVERVFPAFHFTRSPANEIAANSVISVRKLTTSRSMSEKRPPTTYRSTHRSSPHGPCRLRSPIGPPSPARSSRRAFLLWRSVQARPRPAPAARNGTAARIIGSGGVSLGMNDHWLTRSNHRSHAVMSSERIVQSVATGGFLSAHRNTRKSFQYLEVLVRILCS